MVSSYSIVRTIAVCDDFVLATKTMSHIFKVCNSLDAKSTSIAVRINLSNFRIQVADNGEGISKEDMEVVGTRYMSNKCHNVEELTRHINSYGFRGEALSSIIELSEAVNVSSRRKDSVETYRVTFVDCKREDVRITKYRPSFGTTITVYDFLSKLPVRRLRIILELEIEEIKKILEYLIIINPRTSFTLRDDVTGVLILDSPKTIDIIGSFRYLYPEINESFLLLKVAKSKVSLDCLIHKNFFPSKRYQFIYVNKRPVISTKLQKFLTRAFVKSHQSINIPKKGLILPQSNQYPAFVLNIKCAQSFVDVLQNPLKCGVEFEDWNLIFSLVNKLVRSYFGEDEEEVKVPKVDNKKDGSMERGVSQVFGAVKACAYRNNLDQDERSEDSVARNVNVREKHKTKKVHKSENELGEKKEYRALKPEKNRSSAKTCEFDIDKILEDIHEGDRENPKALKKHIKRRRKRKSPASSFNFAKFQEQLKKDAKTSKDKHRERPTTPFVKNKTGRGPTQNTAENYEIQDSGQIEPIKPPKLRSIMKKPLQISTENAKNQIVEQRATHSKLHKKEFNDGTRVTGQDEFETKQNEDIRLTQDGSDKSIFSTFTIDENKGKDLIMDMFLKSTQIFQSRSDTTEDEHHEIPNKSTDNSSQETIMESNFVLKNNYRDTFQGINATMSMSVNVKRKRPREKKTLDKRASKAVQTTIYEENIPMQLAKNNEMNYKPEFKRSKSNLSDLTKKLDNFGIKAPKKSNITDNYTILISGNVHKRPNFIFVPKQESQKSCSELEMFKPFQQKNSRCHCNDGNFFNFTSRTEKTIPVEFDSENHRNIDVFENILASTPKTNILQMKNIVANLGIKPHSPQNIDREKRCPNKADFTKPQDNREEIPVFRKPIFTCFKKQKANNQKNECSEKSPYFATKSQQNFHRLKSPVRKSDYQPKKVDIPNKVQHYANFQSNSPIELEPSSHIDSQVIYKHRMQNIRSEMVQNVPKCYITQCLCRHSENISYAQPIPSNCQHLNQYPNYADYLREVYIPNFPERPRRQGYGEPIEYPANVRLNRILTNDARNHFFHKHRLGFNDRGVSKDICRYRNCCENQKVTYHIQNNEQIYGLENEHYKIVSLRYPEKDAQSKQIVTNELKDLNAEVLTERVPERWSQERNITHSYPTKYQDSQPPPNQTDNFSDQNMDEISRLKESDKIVENDTFVLSHASGFDQNTSFGSEENLSKINYSAEFSSNKSLNISSERNIVKSSPIIPVLNTDYHGKSPRKRSVLECFLDIPVFERFNSKESGQPPLNPNKEKPLSSVLEISLPDETEKQRILNREIEENVLENQTNNFFGSNAPMPTEINQMENYMEAADYEENNKIIIDSQNVWLKRSNDDGENYYVNPRTGLVTKERPKVNNIQFNFDIRRDCVPKGMSPVLKGHKDVDKSMSQNAKKKLQEFILESYDNELLVVKWENYITDDPKQFFKEIYEERSKLFESCIPSICCKQSNTADSIFSFSKSLFYNLQVIGQVDKKFIAVIEKQNNVLILFDQHAVHERIRAEKLLRAYSGSKATCKENVLLFMPQSDLMVLKKHENYLSSLGLDVTFFPNGVRVQNVPLCIEEQCSKESSENVTTLLTALVKEVIELLRETRGSGTRFPKIIQNLINLKACRDFKIDFDVEYTKYGNHIFNALRENWQKLTIRL